MSAIIIHRKEIILDGTQISSDEVFSIDTRELERWQAKTIEFLKEWYGPSEYIMAKSSGSTGVPKNIELAKSTLRKSAEYTSRYLNIKKGNSALLCMPVNFIGGKMMIIRSLVKGLILHIIEASSYIKFEGKIDLCALTPHQCLLTLSNDPSAFDKFNQIIIGGGAIDSSLQNLIDLSPAKYYSSFGMTETASHIALRPLNGLKQSLFFQLISKDIEIQTNVDSCLIIKADYLGRSPIVTNDIVEIIEKDKFKWLGRKDNVINSGGIKIHPELIEDKLKDSLPYRFIIFGEKDKIFQESVALLLETENINKKVDLRNIFIKKLNKYEIPKSIFLTAKLKEAANGKIDRAASISANRIKIEI